MAHKNKYEIEEMAKNAYSEAYNQFFYQLFNENIEYNEAPVTDNFINEFKDGINKKFNIEAEEIYTTVDTIDKYTTVECRNEIGSQGEAQKTDIIRFLINWMIMGTWMILY